MENLIYLVVVIAYFIWQAQQGRKKGQVKRDAENQPVEQDGRRVREVRPITIEEQMREIFREVEMKQKPFARPEKQVSTKRVTPPTPPVVQKERERKIAVPGKNNGDRGKRHSGMPRHACTRNVGQ